MRRGRKRLIGSVGTKFVWHIDGKTYRCKIEMACPTCKVEALVKLPPPLKKQQPDNTTHVCHPLYGGCGDGFAWEYLLRVVGHPKIQYPITKKTATHLRKFHGIKEVINGG